MDSGCTGGDYIVSRNTTITPPQLITASYFLPNPSAPPANVLNFGYNENDFQSWCTDTNDPNPYIIIPFSIPVVITSFISSGSTDFSFTVLDTFHVTNFTLEFAHNSSDGFRYYKTDEDTDRKVGASLIRIVGSSTKYNLIKSFCLYNLISLYVQLHVHAYFNQDACIPCSISTRDNQLCCLT